MTTSYEMDVVAWANEQAAFIRAGKFDLLDLEHLAEEIEDVGKSENRELVSRMAVLLAHLLKWQYQPERRSKSWQYAIKTQRTEVSYVLDEAPSLTARFSYPKWLHLVWSKAKAQAQSETGLDIDIFPEPCPWLFQNVLAEGWLPA
jgi:hypothetical protein